MPSVADLWMQHALALAERGRGSVEPNPLVGAVLVKNGQIIGEGWHERFGGPHAEIHALEHAGEHARGSTLYVTLEPCCHHGKTPPCTDAIIKAGVANVVAALEDPFPQVAGQGAQRLRAAGIPLDFGPGGAEARRQNAPYLTLLQKRRPHVHGKWAMSLDGKIATQRGDSKWISNEASRRVVHDLRGRMDCILVGIGTALADDPQLTARPSGLRLASRIVLDASARLPLSSHLATTARETPTLVVVDERTSQDALSPLQDRGCEIIPIAQTKAGHLDVTALLLELGRRRFTNLLVEGGGKVLASFAEADLLDELHVFIAPKLIGGETAPGPVRGKGVALMRDAKTWPHVATRFLEGDIYAHCFS